MSCNGCRVLRKGCSDNCVLRQCLQCIDNPQAQGHATVFVAKFFGRACLMSFISNVPEPKRPALFQSLLYEAVGRTVNPVNGVIGLLRSGNWHVCQAAVESVLRGGTLQSIPDILGCQVSNMPVSEPHGEKLFVNPPDLDLCLIASPGTRTEQVAAARKRRRETTPSEESETTTLGSNYCPGGDDGGGCRETLKLFL